MCVVDLHKNITILLDQLDWQNRSSKLNCQPIKKAKVTMTLIDMSKYRNTA